MNPPDVRMWVNEQIPLFTTIENLTSISHCQQLSNPQTKKLLSTLVSEVEQNTNQQCFGKWKIDDSLLAEQLEMLSALRKIRYGLELDQMPHAYSRRQATITQLT